ncbi:MULTISPECIES: exopolyphosphatase [Acinetobacter]|jgi:exopolyphosphatase/guanosine-5'-triphosphate,3'-diphosphate pyrophosphatase|uniref:Exopolyphosphatase n=3 Tax=Acinetobacter johnsonii TaxID=40214 RepID=A0A0W8H3K5_ACIJO|nr:MULTISPECIES: exopolyphosphatase [Acinetobacter]MDA0776042.1 exopolyphosphatase [Pseudomonadota bacterium]MDN5444591.1 exopolyphosphatase [Pseudomonadales bacterium]NWK49142.1 exopolyphosphatase [Acinetobacter sp. SwsAc7]NWK64033.1 exopolyphosphatase [Acinetobacter sp. SwsAc3]ALV73842.1 exopolyphosphatase [Acinetobacter johnsonii XBB1]
MSDFLIDEELLAAIDMGSNSFHLAIARVDHGEVKKVASMSEKVQLAAGLDENKNLTEAAQQRGLACLSRFVGRLGSVQPNRLRIVATNALRQAKNGHEFIQKAAEILPKHIEIIAGREEARLIYLGVSHTMVNSGRRLVIDIGGGSTELIIGEEFEPIHTESLQMGCVAFTKAFFVDGEINQKSFDKAVVAARKELSGIANTYKEAGWDTVVGSSGTIKACRQITVNMGWSNEKEELTRDGLDKLKEKLLKYKHVAEMEFDGLKEDRRAVLPAGIAILYAIFDVLELDKLVYSDGALREGVMYDLLGRFQHEDIRDRSVQALMGRYNADPKQAERVVNMAQHLFDGVADSLKLTTEDSDLLRRAAYLHEIGLAISHAGYHRHGAYLLQHSDIAGFSQIDQNHLSHLVAHHRRKLRSDARVDVMKVGGNKLVYLCLLLRLAVLLNHSRSDQMLPAIELTVGNAQQWQLSVSGNAAQWPLLVADLHDEQAQFKHWDVELDIQSEQFVDE